MKVRMLCTPGAKLNIGMNKTFVGQKANLPKTSFVQADNLHTVPKTKLVKYIGTLDPETMNEISKKVVLSLQLESCIEEF